jgi:hypothetical protein
MAADSKPVSLAENKQSDIREKAKLLLKRYNSLQKWRQKREKEGEETRAFIVEFAGMPKAGKSGAIENVRHFFSHGKKALVKLNEVPEAKDYLPYKVDTPAEGVSLRTPGLLKNDYIHYNCWAGSYAVQELLQARHDNYHHLVILDRGPWDAGCWLEYWLNEDGAGAQEADFIKDYFHDDYWKTRADLHVVLTVEPSAAKEREQKHRLIDHGGPASDEKLMTSLKKIYDEKVSDLKKAKADSCPETAELTTLAIDTTHKSPQEVSLEIIERILDVLDAKVKVTTKARPAAALASVLQPLAPLYRGTGKSLATFRTFVKREIAPLPKENRAKILGDIDEWLKENIIPDAEHNRDPKAIDDIEKALKKLIDDARNSKAE